LKPEVRDRGLCLVLTLAGLHVSGHSCIMFGSEEIRTRFVRISFVVIFSSFISMGKVEG